MTSDRQQVDTTLTRRFLLDYPVDAARKIEALPPGEVLPILCEQSVPVQLPVWRYLAPTVAATLLIQLPAERRGEILTELPPQDSVRLLGQMEKEQQTECLSLLSEFVRRELTALMQYPPDSAGRLMDTRITLYHGHMTVSQALDSLRQARMKTARSLFLVDERGRLSGKVLLQDVAIATPDTPLTSLAQPVTAAVQNIAPREEVQELFEKHHLFDLPVVDIEGCMLGIITHASLVQVAHEDTASDVLAMVGASRDERALSGPLFAVKKRITWLQINLLTAFLAASVVGLFEETIATYTALAILLPVVAGMSGNSGAQALAVTIRGLALREITIRHWFPVMFKEVRAGFINGVAIAITCGLGVFIWSGSIGLVLIIALSMVLAMVAAGLAGSLVPITLVRLGQDPAQASSIILTTVTDVTGFFAFLGIATLLSGML